MSIGTSMWNGVSGLNSFSTAMTVVSDNVANASTTAFKAASVHFGDMVNTYLALQSDNIQSEGAGSAILGVSTNMAQGNLQTTDKWSDLAVSGKGFFVVKEPVAGATDGSQEQYTRDGSFHLDKDGYLVNEQGYRVQGYDANGTLTDILIADPQQYASISIDDTGKVTAILKDGTSDPNVDITVGLAEFTNENGLVRQGGNLYIAGPEIGNIYHNDPATIGDATSPKFGKITDFSLEGSNVDMAKEMVNMIIYQASYNANSKSITTSRDMLDTTVNLVR